MFPAALRAQVAGRVLLVGDAVAVDIESAVTAGWDSLLVLISSSASHSARLAMGEIRRVGLLRSARDDRSGNEGSAGDALPGEGVGWMTSAATPADADADDAAALGGRIRELRKRAGLTLDSVADAAQISASLLSRVERGAAQPSLPSLRTIARALGVPISALFEGEDRSTANESDAAGRRLVVRHADRRRLRVPDSRIQYELMVPDLDGAIEVIWGAIPPGGGATRPSSQPGEEVVVAFTGHVAVVVDDQEFVLAAGDTIRFDRSRPHRLHNPRATVAEFLLIVAPPSR